MDYLDTARANTSPHTGDDSQIDHQQRNTHLEHGQHSSTDRDHHPHPLLQPSSPGATSASTKYMMYPTDRPFLNSDFPSVTAMTTTSTVAGTGSDTHSGRQGKTVNTYPTSDRDAVISALRNLQDKVKKLELERTEAEQNLHTLASETEHYKEMLNHDKTTGKGKQFTFSTFLENGDGYANNQAKELEGQLSSAESRCLLLEKQLENMRTMVHNSERNRRELMERTARAQRDKERALVSNRQGEVAGHVDRLSELERDQMKLTATQSLAETKIRELEEKVKEERVHRRLLQERTAYLESEKKQPTKAPPPRVSSAVPHAPRIPVTTQTPHIQKKSTGTSSATTVKTKKPPKKKMKKKVAATKRPASATTAREQSRHYRLNLAEIPFVAGQSTSASHSLGANVQKVLAMMKSHNKALCTSHAWTGSSTHGRSGSPSTASVSSSTGSTGDATESSTGGAQGLGELLAQLQDEFGQLCSQQQDVMTELHAAHARGDLQTQTQLESELDGLVSRMETKSSQIAKIRLHQNKLENGKKSRPVSGKTSMKSKRPHSAGGGNTRVTTTTTNGFHNHHNPNHYQYSHSNYQHTNNTNGNLRPKPHSCNKPVGHSALGKPALFMLRDMKKLQSTLRKDDLCWE